MPEYDAVIVGAGFAGLSAGVELAGRGARVIVLEARRQLGGRATSYRDRVTGDDVDNGQHVLFGCYRETFRFLRAIGVDADVQLPTTLGVSYVGEGDRTIRFQCPQLPPPLHLLGGVVEWDELSASERVAALKIVGPLRRARRWQDGDRYDTVCRDGETVRDWLVRHGQGRRIRELLWEPLALAALNQHPDHAAAAPFVRVLAELCGPGRSDSAVGIPTRPLQAFYAGPARAFIESRGGAVRTGAPARLTGAEGRLMRVEAPGETLRAPAVIIAVPWFELARVFQPAPAPLAGVLERAAGMDAAPIVSVHLWFEAPFLSEPFLGLIGRTMQWVFDKRSASETGWSRVTLVSSGAESVVGLPNDRLIERAVLDLRSTVPAAREVRVAHAVVIRERRATFSLAPGQPTRPGTETGIPGLYLAGDWIETGFPSTIESAVVSGHRAARLAWRDLSH